MSWKLKILSGKHKNAEIILHEGTISIGSDDLEADLILIEKENLPVAFKITIDPETVWLTDVVEHLTIRFGNEIVHMPNTKLETFQDQNTSFTEEKVSVQENINEEQEPENKEQVQPLGLELPRLKEITIDDFTFCVGHGEDEWPSFEKVEEEPLTEFPVESGRFDRIKKIFGKKDLVLISVGFIVAIFFFWLFSSDDNHDVSIQKEQTQVKQMRQYIVAEHYKSVTVKWDFLRNRAIVSGYVRTNLEKEDIRSALNTVSQNFDFTVTSVEELLSSVELALARAGYTEIVAIPAQILGSIILKGNVENDGALANIRSLLKADVPALKSWSFERTDQFYMNYLTQEFRKVGISNKIAIKKVDDFIKVTGVLDKNELQKYIAVMQIYNKRYPDAPKLALNVMSLKDTMVFWLKKHKIISKLKVYSFPERIEMRGNLDSADLKEYNALKKEFKTKFPEAPPLVLTAKKPADILKDWLSEFQLANNLEVVEADKKIILKGILSPEQLSQYSQLIQKFTKNYPQSPVIELKLFASEPALDNWVFEMGLGDAIAIIPKDGYIQVLGDLTVTQKGSYQRLFENYKKYFPKGPPLRFVQSTPEQQLTIWLRNSGLFKKVQLKNTGSEIQVNGVLSDYELNDLRSILKKYSDRYRGKGLPLRLLAIATQSNQTKELNLNLQSVSFGEEPSVTLSDNKSYFIGSTIPGGFKITKIESNKVTFIKDGNTYYITLGYKNGSGN